MEQDKLYNQIKNAAENAEHKDFPGMDKVWSRVEDKLDHKLLQKQNRQWKKIAVAASVLLTATMAYLFFKWNTPIATENKTIVVKDSLLKKTELPEQTVVTHPDIKPEAGALIDTKTEAQTETVVSTYIPREQITEVKATEVPPMHDTTLNKDKTGKLLKPRTETTLEKPKQNASVGSRKDQEFPKTASKSAQKKENPLVVIDGKAAKSKTLSNMDEADVESVVVLDNPLYIINGTYYTEQQLFGPNPTSPYTPLDKQDIETVSVLQGEKAVALYGKKGENGIVIITTKNGKPANLSGKKN